MQKPSNRNSQDQDQGDHLCFRPISFLLLNVVGVLTVTLGTARTLTFTFESQKTVRPAVSLETVVKPPIVQPAVLENIKHIQSKGNQKVRKREAIFLPFGKNSYPTLAFGSPFGERELLTPTTSLYVRRTESPTLRERLQQTKSGKRTRYPSRMPTANVNTLIAHSKSQNQKSQPLQNSQKGHQQRQQDLVGARSAIDLKLATGTQVYLTQGVAEVIPQKQFSGAKQVDRLAEAGLKQNQQEPLPDKRGIKLTLSDVVLLALENNRFIKNAYLERIAQRQDLAVEEDKFAPDFTPTLAVSLAELGSGATRTLTGEASLGVRSFVRIPTGGELSFEWTGNAQTPNSNGLSFNTDDTWRQNLQISFNQPLFRGAGSDVNRASVETARLTEQINVLALKSTLIDTITDVILSYRNLLQAQEQLKIERLSLDSAQQILEINRVLIEAGRLAPVEIVQSETAVANRQVSLVAAENNLESTRLALIQILDIDRDTNIMPAEIPKASPTPLDSNKLRQLALENRPDYLQAQLNLKRAKLDLLQAENNRRWDLGFNVSYGNAGDNTADVRAGLNLTNTVGDLTKKQRFERSRVNLLQTETSLEDLRESLEIQVIDTLRDVNLSLRQVQLAQQARELSERQLEIGREQQRLGRGSGVFEIVSLQDSLVEARNAELNATIEYLNALTTLDRTVGTTLDTWQVTLETNKK